MSTLTIWSGSIADHVIEILIETDYRPCYMRATHTPSGVVRRDGLYPNARSLSADLRSTLGLGPAVDWLQACGVPIASELYDMNHDGAEIRAFLTQKAQTRREADARQTA